MHLRRIKSTRMRRMYVICGNTQNTENIRAMNKNPMSNELDRKIREPKINNVSGEIGYHLIV